jgi:hypothetical protein
MWKRDEAVKPTGQPATPAAPSTPTQTANVQATPPAVEPRRQQIERDVVNIGKSVVIKGELNGTC